MTAARSATTSRFGGAMQHDLHVGYQRYTDAEDLLRSSNGWGVITVAGRRPHELQRHANLLHRAHPAADAGGAPIRTRSITRRASRSTTRSAARTGRSTSACWPATTRCTGQGLREDACDAVGLRRRRRGNKYKMYEIPFGKMIQPRLERDLGLQRHRHGVSGATRATTRRRARCRAPRRGIATSSRRSSTLLRRERRALRRRRPSPRHRASSSSTT